MFNTSGDPKIHVREKNGREFEDTPLMGVRCPPLLDSGGSEFGYPIRVADSEKFYTLRVYMYARRDSRDGYPHPRPELD